MRTIYLALLTAAAALATAFAPAGALAGPVIAEEATSIVQADGDRSTATTVWFQGFLADDATGEPINATYNIVARIYSLAAGGVLLWGPETHAGVTITEGWFNIELGSIVSPLPNFATPPYYLSLQVNGEYLSPRLKLASVPSALQSATSDLLPFSGTYSGGSTDALYLGNSTATSGDALYVSRTNGANAAFAVYAASNAQEAVFRGYQYNSSAPSGASVLLAEIPSSGNDSPVIDAYTQGAGPAYLGETNGRYGIEIYSDAAEAPTDSTSHVIHAVYDGAERGADNVAVYGEALGSDVWGIGGQFVGSGNGVIGVAVPHPTDTWYAYGVMGVSEGPNDMMNVGVYGAASGAAANYGGLFDGNVDIAGTLSKNAGSFKIDHPLDPANKYLSHSFVESPDMMNIYNGNVELDAAGEAWVELPDWFEALNRDFRYQLTPVGAPAPGLYVADEIAGNRFRIAGGEPGTKVSWLVTGIRHDPYADAHRIPVEEAKSAREQGRYRTPELYGMPASAGVRYDEGMAKRMERGATRGRRETRPEAPEGVDPANQ